MRFRITITPLHLLYTNPENYLIEHINHRLKSTMVITLVTCNMAYSKIHKQTLAGIERIIPAARRF